MPSQLPSKPLIVPLLIAIASAVPVFAEPAGLTLEPSVVYEAWCSQRPGNIIVMIEEIHGRPVSAGESFSATHIVGYFDRIEEMHKVYDRYKGYNKKGMGDVCWKS